MDGDEGGCVYIHFIFFIIYKYMYICFSQTGETRLCIWPNSRKPITLVAYIMYVHVKIADGQESDFGVSVCKSLCVHRCSHKYVEKCCFVWWLQIEHMFFCENHHFLIRFSFSVCDLPLLKVAFAHEIHYIHPISQ